MKSSDHDPRARKSRPALALRASFVSQENCLPILGIDPRRYLEKVVPLCRGHVVALGKLRLLPLEVAEDALRGLAAAGESAPATGDSQPETAAAVLAELGMEFAS